MNNENGNDILRMQTINKICSFFKMDVPTLKEQTLEEIVKQICVIRLCKAIGLSGISNIKSEFFDFYSCIMGEAVCEKLQIKLRIASDELRLVKYNHINLVDKVKSYLNNELVEEAVLDAFELADKYKYVIELLKKSSSN